MRVCASPMKRTRRAARSATPVGVVVDASVEIERQRIDGEIAAQRIGGEIAAEMNDRAASVGFHILPQGRDLEWLALDDHRDGAVIDAGRHGLQPGPSGPRLDDGQASPWWRDRLRSPACPRSALRTAPPTIRVSSPPPFSTVEQAAKPRPFQQGRRDAEWWIG